MMLEKVTGICILLFVLSIIFSTAIVQIMVGVLAFLWVGQILARRKVQFKHTLLDIPFLLFMGARVLSIILSQDVSKSIGALYTDIIFFSVFFLITQLVDVSKENRLRLILWTLFIAAGVASCIGIVKYALGLVPRASSTTAGYYTLGNFLCVVFAIGLCLGRSKEYFPRRWLWGAWCTITAAGIVFTFDRLHWAGMGLMIVACSIVKERWMLPAFIVTALVLALVSSDVANRFSDFVHVFSRSSDRDVLWKGAWMIGDQHPVFGFGPRTFSEIFPLHSELADKGVGSWHNDYLQVYMESGLVGLASLVYLLVSIFYRGVRALRYANLPKYLSDMLVGLLAGMAILSLVGGLLDLLVALLFRLILALIALIVTMYPVQRVQAQST